jgi:hypothetical protein
MAIRKLTFSFEVPITQLLGLIATGNTGLKIDVLSDDKIHALKALNGARPKLLEGPKKPHGNVGNGGPKVRGKEHGKPITAYNAIIRALAKAADHTLTVTDLRSVVGSLGLSPSSASPQISAMRTHWHVKHIGEATYQLTKNGLAEAEKRHLIRPKKTAPVAAEADHG